VSGNFLARWVIVVVVLLLIPLQGLAGAEEGPRATSTEGQDDDAHNNDDFSSADVMASDTFLEGSTNIGDQHRIDTFVLKDVPAGKIINASVQMANWSNQALMLIAWNRYTQNIQASSNREDAPTIRRWEAVSLICVVTGDYYLQLKPIAGSGKVDYILHARIYDAEDITSKFGSGGVFGAIIAGNVSSEKWYPCEWYRFRMSGEENGLNEYAYVNLTLPGSPDERLMADLYLRSLEPESWSYWLNHSWWLDDSCQYQELYAAACHPGERWYYITVHAADSTGPRSDCFELRATKLWIESDGDNHPLTATPVRFATGNFTAGCYG